MFKVFISQKDLTIDQVSCHQSKESVTQIQNVQFQKIQNNDFFQLSQDQTFKSLTQTVRSRKSLFKNKLKNTLLLPKAVSIMNLKQDQLTAASLKDLELDFQPNQKLKTSSQKENSISNQNQFSSMRYMNQNYQIFQDQYQTLQIIGQGAHSTVYKSQILQTLKDLHSEGICHRDIKPQNILYNKFNHHIKVIDLDVCGVKKYKSENFDLWTNTGTLFYRAPQTFGIGYNQKSDIWSLGVMIYQILIGRTPFQTQYEKDFITKISTTQINYQRLQTTKKIRYLIQNCLKKNSQKRSSASQLLNFLYSINKEQITQIEKKQNFCYIKQKKQYFEQSDKQLICSGNLLKFILS